MFEIGVDTDQICLYIVKSNEMSSCRKHLDGKYHKYISSNIGVIDQKRNTLKNFKIVIINNTF